MNYSIFLLIFLVGTSCAMEQEEYVQMVREKKKLDLSSPAVQGPIFYPAFNEANEVECSICFELVDRKELPPCTMTCNHVFHFDCIKGWIEKNPTCPLCRAKDEVSVKVAERKMMRVNHNRPAVSIILGMRWQLTNILGIIGSEDS